jgi:hypothetical protein
VAVELLVDFAAGHELAYLLGDLGFDVFFVDLELVVVGVTAPVFVLAQGCFEDGNLNIDKILFNAVSWRPGHQILKFFQRGRVPSVRSPVIVVNPGFVLVKATGSTMRKKKERCPGLA